MKDKYLEYLEKTKFDGLKDSILKSNYDLNDVMSKQKNMKKKKRP